MSHKREIAAALAFLLLLPGCGSSTAPEKTVALTGGSAVSLTELCPNSTIIGQVNISAFDFYSSIDQYTNIKKAFSATGTQLFSLVDAQKLPDVCDLSFEAKIKREAVKDGKIDVNFIFYQPLQVNFFDVNGELQPDSARTYEADEAFLLSLPIRTRDVKDGYYEITFLTNQTKLNISVVSTALKPTKPEILNTFLTFEYKGVMT